VPAQLAVRRSSTASHSTHPQLGEEVTIYYRYHPYHGETGIIRERHIVRDGEEVLTVLRPNGELSCVPTWMLEPQLAERLDIHEPPRLSRECLNELREFVTVALAALEAAASATDPDSGGA
jgi:hypothetical protein